MNFAEHLKNYYQNFRNFSKKKKKEKPEDEKTLPDSFHETDVT